MPLDDTDTDDYEGAGRLYGIEPNLLRAMSHVESTDNDNAVSPQGAQGRMQMLPATARAMGVTDPFDKRQSIYGGAKYLSQMYQQFGSPDLAIAAYHGGPNPDNWGPKTRAYLGKVVDSYSGYRPTNAAFRDSGEQPAERPGYVDTGEFDTSNDSYGYQPAPPQQAVDFMSLLPKEQEHPPVKTQGDVDFMNLIPHAAKPVERQISPEEEESAVMSGVAPQTLPHSADEAVGRVAEAAAQGWRGGDFFTKDTLDALEKRGLGRQTLVDYGMKIFSAVTSGGIQAGYEVAKALGLPETLARDAAANIENLGMTGAPRGPIEVARELPEDVRTTYAALTRGRAAPGETSAAAEAAMTPGPAAAPATPTPPAPAATPSPEPAPATPAEPRPAGMPEQTALRRMEEDAAPPPARAQAPPATVEMPEVTVTAKKPTEAERAEAAAEPEPVPPPVAPEAPELAPEAPATTPQAATPLYETVPREPTSLIEYLKRPTIQFPGTPNENRIPGGIQDPNGDLRAIIGGSKGRPGLINKNGRSWNDALTAAWEDGYFPEAAERSALEDNDLQEAVRDEIGGIKRYSVNDQDRVDAYKNAMGQNAEIDRLADRYDIEPKGMTREQFDEAITAKMSTEESAAEQERLQAASQKTEAEIRRVAGQELPDIANPGELYEQSQARPLEDLDREYQQEIAAAAAVERIGAPPETGRERPAETAGEAVEGSDGSGAAPAGRTEAAGEAEAARDLLGRPIAPKVEPRRAEPEEFTIRNDPNQTVLPGTKPSARQAQAARDAGPGTIRSEAPQKAADEGIFAPDVLPVEGQGELPEPRPKQEYNPRLTDPGEIAANKLSVDALNGATSDKVALEGLARLAREGAIPESVARINLERLSDWTEGDWQKALAGSQAPGPKRIRTLNDIMREEGVTASKARKIQDDEIIAAASSSTPLYSFPGMLFDPATYRRGITGIGDLVRRVAALPQISTALSTLAENAGNFGRAIQMMTVPMAAKDASIVARATAKNWANLTRLANREGHETINWGRKNFTPEQRQRMWDAADADSVAMQTGNAPRAVAALAPNERAAVQAWQKEAKDVWDLAVRLGMVSGPGLPSYAPRMLIDMASGMPSPFKRGLQGTQAEVARDILTLPLATMRLREAVAGRMLINKIRDLGGRMGQNLVMEGMPNEYRTFGTNLRTTTPQMMQRKYLTTEETEAAASRGPAQGQLGLEDEGFKYFTIGSNPAFKTSRPMLVDDGQGGRTTVKDGAGNVVFEKVPLKVRADFEGPLRSIMQEEFTGPITQHINGLYNGLMDLKGRMMTSIMYGVAHLGVVVGRTLPAAPNLIRVWRDGAVGKADPAVMRDLIANGLVPISSRMGFRDVAGMMDDPQLTPGRSWTSKLLAAVPGVFDKRAGEAVKRGVDNLGDFMHNTLLWDQVQSIQVGLAMKFRDHLTDKGVDPVDATQAATHFANVYAGALPREAMSQGARAIANMVLFSRSYRLGNLAAIKDMVVGLPKDVQAQIAQRGGTAALTKVVPMAKRKAVATLGMDMAMYYAGNALVQNIINAAAGYGPDQQQLPQNTPFWRRMGAEFQGYARRTQAEVQQVMKHPSDMLNPFGILQSLSPLGDHEPAKQNRILVGYDNNGTGLYIRNPTGKFAEDITDYATQLPDTLKRMLSPYAKPVYAAAANDAGFGHKLYFPLASTPRDVAEGLWNFTKMAAMQPFPWLSEMHQAAVGRESYGTAAGKLALSSVGAPLSRGYPGGEGAAQYSNTRAREDWNKQQAMPGIMDKIRAGDENGARQDMFNLGMSKGEINYYVNRVKNPSQLSKGQQKNLQRWQNQAAP